MIRARPEYEEGLRGWRKVLDNPEFQSLVDDVSLGGDLMDVIRRYQKCLDQDDQDLPDPFILQDVIDKHGSRQGAAAAGTHAGQVEIPDGKARQDRLRPIVPQPSRSPSRPVMPRRNLHCLLLITLFSLVCYQKVPGSRYSRVLADAMDHVSRRFYQPVNELNLFEGAMSGMIERLGDEHSKYIKAAKKQEFEEDLNQEFVGIGIRPAIDPQTKQLLVLSSLPGGPAFAAGIRAGDRIVKIEAKARRVCR